MLTKTCTEVWVPVARVSDFPPNGGGCVQYNSHQIAVFNYTRRNQWFATDNQCPHKKQMILSRGMIGDQCGTPKVACPYHKKTFSLENGQNLNGDEHSIRTYPVKVEQGVVYLEVSILNTL